MSSPHRRDGVLWEADRRYFGKDAEADVIYWAAATRDLNPTVPEAVIDRAMADDPARARAEYLAEYRDDISGFLAADAIAGVVPAGVRALPPDPEREAVAHCDTASGIANQDAAALGVALRPREYGAPAELALLVRWTPAFSALSVVAEAAAHLRRYGVSTVSLDRYATNVFVAAFAQHGIHAELAERDTSRAFVELMPNINARSVRLLDDPVLVSELRALERRAGPSGRDTVSHPMRAGAHDDCAAAAAQALVQASMDQPGGVLANRICWSDHAISDLLGTRGDGRCRPPWSDADAVISRRRLARYLNS
jgi:hypothetical protein